MSKQDFGPYKVANPNEFWIEERCFITELVSLPESSLAIARVEPGVTTQLHSLDVSERYTIIEGTGRAEINGHDIDVVAGDTLTIPAGIPQRITNTGKTDLRFYCLCLPAFGPDSYTKLGD